ncbi:WXG100 family type VII secretion target [Amycolatopsis sp. NPDC004368]
MAGNQDSGYGQQPPAQNVPVSGSAVQLGDNSVSQNIVDSARGRAGGFEMGGDRAIANPPNWNAQESHQLYNGAITDNDPGTAEATGQHWTKHGTELKTASDDLFNAVSELGNAWVGEGAAGAQSALVSIAASGTQASDAAHTMADRLAKQAAAAAEVKKMPAPLDYDPKQAMSAALAGGPAALAADQKAQADAANDVKAQQVAFFNAYTQSMKEVDNTTPSFGPDSLGMKPTATHFNGNDFGNVGTVAAPVSAGALAAGTYAMGRAGYSGHGGSGSAGGASGAGGPQVTANSGEYGTSGFDGGVAASAAGTGAAPAPAPVAPAASAGGGGGGGGAASALGLSAVGGGVGFAGGKLGQGSRSGSRNEEETTRASSERQGAQAGAAPAQQQGVVSAGGTIGGQPTPGMNPMGGGMGGGMGHGGGQGQEDQEHTHASFLIEPDPDDAFGANEATPPPVIGAWSDDDN